MIGNLDSNDLGQLDDDECATCPYHAGCEAENRTECLDWIVEQECGEEEP